MIGYSPLCDTDPVLYSRYLSIVSRLVEGLHYESDGCKHSGPFWCVEGIRLGSRVCADVGLHETESDSIGLAHGADSGGGRVLVGSGVCHGEKGDCGELSAVGVEVDGSGDAVCDSVNVNCDDGGLDKHRPSTLVGEGCGSGERVRVDLNSLGLPKGRNWARNVAARERRREKKKKMRGDWRVGSSSGAQGFFSECDADVRKELRDSRAALLIAQNKRRAAEEEKKIAIAGSVEGVVNELIRVTKLASDLKKQAGDTKIGGWAQTVADSLAKSVADSAPSTIPSLESVGYGKSALRSSDGNEFVDMGRVTDYENEIKAVNDYYDTLDGYSQDDYDLAVKRIKIKYSDVSQTPEERKEKELVGKIIDSLSATGLPMDKIEFAFDQIGIEVY